MSTKPQSGASALGTFVGRADVVATITRALREGRSIAIVGPPGVGKTRVAREVLRLLDDERAVFSDLSDVRDREGFVARLGAAAGLRAAPAQSALESEARLARGLAAHEPTVFVLDNFEQLDKSVDDLLASAIRASAIGFLVTSRRRVACGAEHVELGPLDTRARPGTSWSEAATLLVARAAETAKVHLDVDDRDAVHALCEKLDGLPLAIELAAARLSILTAAQLSARLDRRFETLDGRTGRGLAAALETSFALLDEPARACLVACSVFRGGIALEALEAVVGRGPELVDAIATLRDHSLLTASRAGAVYRYDLAHSIRGFVEERAGVERALFSSRRAHAEHFTEVARAARADPSALASELENLRAALAWATQHAPDLAGELALALSSPLVATSYEAAHELVSRVLDAERESPAPRLTDAALAELLLRRGTVRRFLADFSGAVEDLERARSLAQRLGARALEVIARSAGSGSGGPEPQSRFARPTPAALEAETLANLGNTLSGKADWEGARRYITEALAIHPSPTFRPSALAMLANTFSNEDDYARAEPLLREAILAATELRDSAAASFARLSLGILLVERSAFDEAYVCLSDALTEENSLLHRKSQLGPLAPRAMQAGHLRAVALTHLARVKQETGDPAGALTDYHEALAAAEESGARRAEAFALYGLGSLLLELGELRAADDRLRAALPLVRETCKDVEGALVALQGVLFARRGARADAERFFRRAEALLLAHKRPVFEVALSVLRNQGDRGSPYSDFADVRLARRLRALIPDDPKSEPLFVARDASFFRHPESGEPISLARRKAVRGVLRCLVEARLERPGIALSVEALVNAGWPGERILPAAGAERVYAAIATLRKLGLRGFIAQEGDGYLLLAERAVVLHDPK
ncbi:MAG: tetratricopeptide repeat protein [Polyangiaceae bacterium]